MTVRFGSVWEMPGVPTRPRTIVLSPQHVHQQQPALLSCGIVHFWLLSYCIVPITVAGWWSMHSELLVILFCWLFVNNNFSINDTHLQPKMINGYSGCRVEPVMTLTCGCCWNHWSPLANRHQFSWPTGRWWRRAGCRGGPKLGKTYRWGKGEQCENVQPSTKNHQFGNPSLQLGSGILTAMFYGCCCLGRPQVPYLGFVKMVSCGLRSKDHYINGNSQPWLKGTCAEKHQKITYRALRWSPKKMPVKRWFFFMTQLHLNNDFQWYESDDPTGRLGMEAATKLQLPQRRSPWTIVTWTIDIPQS